MAKSIIVYNNCECGENCEHYGKPHYSNEDTHGFEEPYTLDYYLTTLGLVKDLESGITSLKPILRRSAYHYIIPNDALLEGL